MSTTTKFSRRQFLRAAATVAGGAALAACAAPAAPAPAPAAAPKAEEKPKTEAPAAAPVTVRLAAWADVTDKDVYDNIVADFAKVDPASRG